MKLLRRLTGWTALLALAAPSMAQHCGGPCEVPRPAAPPLSPNPRFSLIEGEEKGDWRYLNNFHWAVDGEKRQHLEETLASNEFLFGHRRLFLSPAGNGLLATGNPYVGRGRAPLFSFVSDKGKVLAHVLLEDALTEDERLKGPCPGCSCCKEVLYVFERDPALSADGAFVDLVAAGTGRELSFFLPLGAPIADRAAFEQRLTELDWARVPAGKRDARRARIESLITDFTGETLADIQRAEDALHAEGYRARAALRVRSRRETDPERRARLLDLRERLRPWADRGYEQLAVDLDFLVGFVSHTDPVISGAAAGRLADLVPGVATDDWATWLSENRKSLRWDDAREQFVIR